jgi:integrase
VSRTLHKLTARKVDALREPGRYSDGGNLYLKVDPDSKRWTFRFNRAGKVVELGLGPTRDVTLAEARDKASALRKALLNGEDVLANRKRKLAEADRPSFGAWAEKWIDEAVAPGLKNEKHKAAWQSGFRNHCGSMLAVRVDRVTVDHVLAVLRPIWTSQHETARKLRGRIERALDAAAVAGLREAENPARLKGRLEHMLPKAPSSATASHFEAMPFAEVPTFLRVLGRKANTPRAALRFQIMTAARPGEVRHMTWSDVDLDAAVWTVPPEKNKSARPHAVPLPGPALAILKDMRKAAGGKPEPDALVFPGAARGRPISENTFRVILREQLGLSVDAHAFRSSFRDWCGDATTYPRELAEHALGHVIGDRQEQAYRRGSALDRRRDMMTAWCEFLTGGKP